MAKLTEEQYVKALGLHCPHCGSDQIVGHSVDAGCGSASQEMSCSVCEARWVDIYNLVRYEDLEGCCEHGVPDDVGCDKCNDELFQDLLYHMAKDEGRI